jgi:hypothetical protein
VQTFPVDDDVVEAVWRLVNPKPFENLSFSAALRRVLAMVENGGKPQAVPSVASQANRSIPTHGLEDLLAEVSASKDRSKAPKADLRKLVKAGLLQDNEELYLINYQGVRVQQYKATVSGNHLLYKGGRYSMSDLARDLLKTVGFRSDSVRGPSHWVNAHGISVRDLWQELRDKQTAKRA